MNLVLTKWKLILIARQGESELPGLPGEMLPSIHPRETGTPYSRPDSQFAQATLHV